MIRKNIGRPTSIPNEPSLQTKTACSLRWSTEPYIKTLCIICPERKTSEDTHTIKAMRKGLRMLQVVKEIECKGSFIRLNTIPNLRDAFANDVIYHQSCWIYKLMHIPKTAMSRRYLNCDGNFSVKTKKVLKIYPQLKMRCIAKYFEGTT